jgi:hypothetical protein
MTIRELCERSGLTYSGVLHTERTYPTKVKVDTVILLDSVLEFDGELVGLTWALTERELAEKFQFQ